MAFKRRIRRQRRNPAPTVRRSGLGSGLGTQRKQPLSLLVGGAHDPAEKAADHMAARALGHRAASAHSMPSVAVPTLHRATSRAQASTHVAAGSSAAQAPRTTASTIANLGSGRAMPAPERRFFEGRFGHDFSSVRIHENNQAHRAARALGARAFTYGKDIAFSEGANDKQTMAHELSHVVQDSQSVHRRLRRDLAIAPSSPDAVPVALTDRQRRSALRYNQRRFEDPFTIRIIRDVYGTLPAGPAIIDDAFIDSTLRWQAEHGLSQTGKFNIATTNSLVRELRAEGQNRLARLIRSDNYVRARTITGPTFTPMATPIANNLRFNWAVGFTTSLRNGDLVQRIENRWNETVPGGMGRVAQSPRYWETWTVNGRGVVNPRLADGTNDIWSRVLRRGTRGNWRMRGTLYTVLNLPATFNARGTAGHVRDSGDLRSSAGLNARQQDQLGLPEGNSPIRMDEPARTIGGEWNAQGPAATWFNRRL